MDLPPLMQTTPGITETRFTQDPLGTEGELTPGPDGANPFRSADEREVVEAYKAKAEQQRQDSELFQTSGIVLPFAQEIESPTEGDDPFVFDDVGGEINEVSLPFAGSDGPEF
jgi:hypothetical protein